MPAVITDAGRALIAAKLAAMETVDITRVKFGNPTFPDPNNPPAPDPAATDVSDVVHTVNGGITSGKINPDQVAYTVFLDSSIGDFELGQVGFFHVEGMTETLVMLANVPTVSKTANAGNNYKHTEILAIKAAAEASGVSIPAATWQLDHTARFRTIEDAAAASISRLLGRFAALDGALQVSAIAPTLRDDAESTAGWALVNSPGGGAVALDPGDFTEGANSLEVSGQDADAGLEKTLGAAQDWSAHNGALADILATSGTAIRFFIEDSLGNRSTWDLTTQTSWTEHAADFAAPDGNNGADADLSDVLKFGFEGLDAATVYNFDNFRTGRINDFALAAGDAVLEGIGRTFAGTSYAEHLNDWNPPPGGSPAVLSPPGAGTRTDTVYLDVWMQPNGSTVEPQAKLTVSDQAQADYVDSQGIQHHVEPIAELERTTGHRITAAMITDARRSIGTTGTGAEQSREERGQPNGYAATNEFGDVVSSGLDRLAYAFQPRPTAPPGMKVRVLPGHLWKEGNPSEIAEQETGTISAPATNPKIVRVGVSLVDGSLAVIDGAEAGSPVPPNYPPGIVPVCRIPLTTAHTEITDSDIVDERALGQSGKRFRGFSARMSANQAVTTGGAKVVEFDTEDFDSDDIFDPVTHTATIPVGMAGKWRFTAFARLTGIDGTVGMSILRDGSEDRRGIWHGAAINGGNANITVTLDCAEGEEFQAAVVPFSDTNYTIEAFTTAPVAWFEAEYLGP